MDDEGVEDKHRRVVAVVVVEVEVPVGTSTKLAAARVEAGFMRGISGRRWAEGRYRVERCDVLESVKVERVRS